MTYKYYILYVNQNVAFGPFNFNEAVKQHRESHGTCVIVKIVLDEQGREVK